MVDILSAIAKKAEQNANTENTYLDDEGFLVCSNCNTRKQCRLPDGLIVHCLCECESQEYEKEVAKEKEKQAKLAFERRQVYISLGYRNVFLEDSDCELPKIKNYIEHFPEFKEENLGLMIWGKVGNGKALTIDTDIITPKGRVKMKDIHVGDKVIGGDGKPCTVIGEYPQGILDTYEITFDDGTKVRCCENHLWVYKTPHFKNKEWRVATLGEMMKKHKVKCASGFTMAIPKAKATEFDVETNLLVPPYLLGALLGDGGLSGYQISFTNTEKDVCEMVFELAQQFDVHPYKHTDIQYILSCNKGQKNKLSKALKHYNLMGTKSGTKFIPKEYLLASISERKELLAGLFDTDGCIAPNGSKSITTTSEQMANDIIELGRSLGYRCTMRKPDERKGSTCYVVGIQTKEVIYKSIKHTLKDKNKKARKADFMSIVNIEKVEKAECKCIAVDNESKTYLCGDYIVTHNTFMASVIANELCKRGYKVMMLHITEALSKISAFENDGFRKDIEYVDLLILDDFGVSRNTDYQLEQLNKLIDIRYSVRKPLIITTNLTREEIGNSEDIRLERTFNRLIEMTHPIYVEGESRRKKASQERYKRISELLGE